MAVFGFNTDLKVGATVFHVQTEDRGANNPVLDTTIYVKGRVLAKRAISYQDFLSSPDFSESELHAMLEEQHKRILEEVRDGTLAEMADFQEAVAPGGISVQLLNPGTFLKGTMAELDLKVTHRGQHTPLGGAIVRVLLHTGAPEPLIFAGQTDAGGMANLQFRMPRLGAGGAQMLIQASADEGTDELKYNLRPKPRAQA